MSRRVCGAPSWCAMMHRADEERQRLEAVGLRALARARQPLCRAARRADRWLS
jgi:hypothetical protein